MYKLLILVFLGLKTQGQQVNLTCPDSWTLIGTSCYSLFSSDQNRIWNSAEVVCQYQGSHLASIRDIYENNEIGRFANSRNVTEYWIGLFTSSEDITLWSNGKNWSLLQGFWADMQPDTLRGQCVYVQKQSMDYTYDRVYAWNVGDCNVKRSFICQRKASPSGSYNCANGGYVSSKWLCDGEGDCSDLSDEISCSNVCRYLLKASSGTINSEGYPNNYTNARFCSWNIEGPLGTNIFLDFRNFQTEAGSDIVKIFVGGKTESTSVVVASLSGSVDVSKVKYLSPNNYMIIQFSTDSAFAKQGFTASYSSISDGAPLVSEITVTDIVQFLQPFTYIVSGQNLYLGNRDYIWKLTAASPRAIITIKIMTLDLKGTDAIFFYDGDSSSASMLARLCESCDNPGIIFSTSDKLYIMMKSEVGSKGSGFNFTMMQGCNIEMTDSYGVFFSPGYGRVNYANGQTCTWTIQTTPELPILIHFEDGAEIEDGMDFLQVFTNATNEVSGVAEHFPNQGFGTKELQHRKFVSRNGKVLVKFITNPIINKKGFRAFYSQDCPDPQFSNGTLVTPVATNYPPGSTHRYKDEVDVMCKTGYRFYQESFSVQAAVRLKCLYKGVFDQHQVPNCRSYYCGEPPAVKFGYVIGIDGVTFLSKANYSCYPGYSFQNKSQITCQDGGWETAPICVAAKCIAWPLSIANGTGTLRQGDGTSVGTIIDYVCNAGYQIQGSSILLCGPNGNWSSALPTCIKLNCPLPRVKNGNFTVTSFPQLGDARTLQCGSGYRTNVTTFICTENRTLSAVPVCQNIDECQARTHGCRSPAVCHDTDGSYYCTCPNGYYLDTDGKTCLDIKECDVKNGYCDDVCNEQSGRYFCTCPKDGYTLFTTDGTANYTIPTSESGTLNTDTFYLSHTCVRVSCPKPPEIANGTLLTNRQFNHYGDVIEYQCKLGYIPRRATLRCDKTGQWSPSPPNCQRATCPSDSPGTLINPANYTSGPYDYGNQLTLQCIVPGRGMFNKTRQCLYNRDSDNYSLYGNQYECGVIDCGKPEQVAGSEFVVPQSTTFGSSFSFVCGNLYTRQGSSSAGDSIVRCGNDSYWDFGSLQCVGASCSDPGYPLGGRQVATSYAQNSIVTFTCDRPGFSLNRSTGIQCVLNTQSNGLIWNDSVPQCVDTEKPVFTNCLKPVDFIRKYQDVRPLLPTTLQVTDNGGGMKIQTISPQNANNTLYMTEQNLTVTYTAEDFFGNTATCQLQYTLTDETPPQITCIAQDAVTLYMPGDTYTYNVTVGNQIRATDIRDTNVTILIPDRILTGSSGNLNQVYMITGIAQDSAGNTDRCAYQVIVQAAPCSPLSLPTPAYGDKNCTSLGNGNYRCDLSCNPGFVFYDHQASATWSLTCTSSQPWPEVIPACILDTIPPVLTCPLSRSVYLVEENSIITIMPREADFNFTDNSGQVTLTIPTSQFNITVNNLRQTFRVSANARDEKGNQVTCSYQILAEAATCSPLSLPTPLHGKKNCSATGNGYACDLSCDAGYEFHERSELVVRSTCTSDNRWSIELPACTSNVNKQSATYTQVFEYQYKNLALNFVADLSCADIYRNGFDTMRLLQGTIFKLASSCQSNFDAGLRINMPFDQVQLRINQGSPNGSVQFTVSVNFTVQIYSASSAVPSWAFNGCKNYVENTVKGQNILGISTFSSNVSQCPSLEANFVTYNVSLHFNGLLCPLETVQSKIDPVNCLYCPEGYRKTGNGSCEKCGIGLYQDVINSTTCKICPDVKTTSSLGTVSSNLCYGDCNAGLISSSGFSPCNECPRNTYYVNRTYCEPCPSGNITLQSAALGPSYCISQSNLQLRCPMGTYQSNPGICSLCPRGTYQNNEGSISCISCSSNFSTYAEGSISITACVAMCSGGFISDSGVPPCRQCPRNTYWINSTYCSPCPNGGITLNTGATTSQLCLSQCPAGYFSYNGYGNVGTCQTCPLHHYQPIPGQTFCIECANGQYTDGIGRTNLTDCKDAATNLCTGNTCRNGGNCTIQFHDYYCLCPKGYYGRNCELEVNLCLSQPCYNGGICRSAPSGYNCTCPTGTNGSRCEIIENKCSQGTRCFNGGYCVNDFNQPGGYRCICLSGFGGANCSQQQSVCTNQPCQNGGQCVDVSGGLNLRRKCICQSGYTGRNCETDINECESNPCLYGATCTDLVNGYRCTCRNPLYNGTKCETRRSPCQNVDCGSGTCVDDYYTDTYRCICNPGYYFGNACDYKIYVGKIVPDISSLPATLSNTTSCRGTCDAQPACQGFSLKGGNCTLLYNLYTEGSLQTNSDYNTYLKSCLRPTDDYFTPWYDVDDPGADFSDMETLSVLRNVYGLTVCGGTDPVNTECRNKNTSVAYPGCSAIGVNCVGNSTNPCADYEVRFHCAVDRVFSDNICFAKDYCEDGNPCMNGGTCVDQAIGYRCNCPVGYTGLNCQTNINDCTNTSCLNGGVCIDGVNTFTCSCTSAYQGQICQTLINYCLINNRCNSTTTRNCVPVENDHLCECYPGYEGQFCEINIDECASQPCYHGSTCKDGINQYICDCTAGWTGVNCNQLRQPCDPQSPCVGQAMCRNIFDDFYCECPASTYGKLCENTPNPCKDYNKCQNSATCSVLLGNMTCTCPNAGFMGDGCHVLTDLCGKTNYCQNGGTCYITQTGYGCTCPKGYVGTNCERNFDDCASSPCPLSATCIDDIGQYYCRCPLGKAGEQCSRTLDTNYDLYFYLPFKNGLATIPYPIPIGNTTGMAVSLWVRYAVPGDDGPFFAFWSGETAKSAIPVLGLNDNGLLLLRDNMTTDKSIPFKFNLKLNDGNWHNLVINYDSAIREYSLIVDSIKHGAQVVLQAPKLSGMWITLGCYGNLQTMKCHDNTGFRGYISQVNVYNRPLNFVSEIPQLVTKPYIVFIPGSILQWNEYSLIHGVRQVIPSAFQGSCQDPLSISCVTRADREAPVIQNCPEDTIVYSDTRLKTVSWTEPTITGAKTTEISHKSGGTYTWGVYNVTYVAKDDNGNAAICTFKIYVQALKGGLDNPDLGSQNCWASGNFLACSISCNSSLSIDRYAPKYFSRGPSGSFNVEDKLFQKPRYPPCGKKVSTAKARISVKLVFRIATSHCPGVKQALTDRLYGALSGAQGPNVMMNMKLCKQPDCKDVTIVITCGSGSGRRKRQTVQTNTVVQLTFSESDPSTANGSLTVEEVLTNQIMGTDIFNFNDTIPNGSMDNNGFDISIVSICPQGQTEIGGICVLCGAGTYFTYYTSENISGYCENCPLGQYQNQSGQSTCLSCSVPGSTTQTTGSTSATDCHASCSAGYYFDISNKSCLPCAIGRYQDKTGQFYCEWCPVGKTTHGINSTSLSECFSTCISGQELNTDGSCVPCEIGYYRNDADSSTCQPCPTGFITKSNGSVSLSDCNIVSCLAGFRRNVTSNMCTLCEKGTYQPDKWMTECISCGPTDRWTTDSIGSANQSYCKFYCPSGYEATAGTECKICTVGTYKDNTVNIFSGCTACPFGMTSPTNGSTSVQNCSIYQCSAGYKNNANRTGCIKCPLGTYQPLVDQLDCMTCPANLSTRLEGSNSSTACETYCPSGQEKVGDMCNQCPIGYYKDNNESLFGTCQRCPDNYVTPFSNRTARALCIIRNCAPGTKRNANDTACEDCPLNMYQPDSYQTSCISCSANTGTRQIRSTNVSQCETFCSSGFEKTSTGCQPCQQGYYKDNSLGLFSACTICPMDFITPGMNATSMAQCNIGNCSAGNFINPSNNSQCLPCAKGYYQPNKWSTSCIQCDIDKTTERNASTNITDCILVCPPGKEDTGSGSCAPCQRGFYKSEYIAAKCNACPAQTTTVGKGANSSSSCSLPACVPGEYLDVAKNICSLCNYDKYQGDFWMESCVNCPPGYVTLKTGATGLSDCVLDCSSGYEYVASSKSCRICPRGSYRNRDDRNQTSCSICPPSKITAHDGAGDVSLCNIANCTMPGQYRDPTSNTCKLCPIGTYVTERWKDTCDQCVSGYTTQNTGSTSSSDCKYDCPSGYSVDAANVCQPCPVGTYRTREATWTCQQCPNGTKTASVGSTSLNACNMSLCQLGQGYINQTCQPCPKGQYQPQAGKFDCISCPASRLYTLQTGAISISDCKSGCSVGQQFFPPSTCQNCSRGTYQDLSNEFNCKSCPANKPYTASEGAANINDCISRCNGSNDCSTNGTCTDVPISTNGYTCACQRNYADTGVPKGLLSGRECVHLCDQGYCKNNAVCDKQGESLKCICSTWYEGEFCQTRVDAQTKSEKFNDTIIGAVVGVVVGLLIIIVIIVACLVWARSRGKTKLNKTKFTNFQPEFIPIDKMSLAGSHIYEFNGQYPYTGSQHLTLNQSREVVYDNRMFAPESDWQEQFSTPRGTQSYYEA